MNIWKPVAIGCMGYIAGFKANQNGRYISNYYTRRNYRPSLRDDVIDILSGKIYKLVYGETRDETDLRLQQQRMQRRCGNPVSYAPVYQSSGGGGSYADYINSKHDEESEENEEEDDET